MGWRKRGGIKGSLSIGIVDKGGNKDLGIVKKQEFERWITGGAVAGRKVGELNWNVECCRGQKTGQKTEVKRDRRLKRKRQELQPLGVFIQNMSRDGRRECWGEKKGKPGNNEIKPSEQPPRHTTASAGQRGKSRTGDGVGGGGTARGNERLKRN